MKFADAADLAEDVRERLAPYCSRVAVAGSVRRCRPEVHDIEIVCIPNQCPDDLFGLSSTTEPGFIRAVESLGDNVRGSPEGRYCCMRHCFGICLDIFMCRPLNWGLILAIRTGSAAFSHQVLANGWCHAGFRSVNGILTRGKQLIPVREEQDLFDLIRVPFIEPENREVQA